MKVIISVVRLARNLWHECCPAGRAASATFEVFLSRKYCPQVWMNYKRNSTATRPHQLRAIRRGCPGVGVGMAEAGWTIYNVLLDLTGGSASFSSLSKADVGLSFAVSGLLSVAQCCPHYWCKFGDARNVCLPQAAS